MTDLFVPKEHRKLYCPYCNAEQNDMNIIKTMYSDPNWVAHTCESCGKMLPMSALSKECMLHHN